MAELDSVKPWIDAYTEANAQIKRYEAIKAQARERIVDAMAGESSGAVNGVERVRIRPVAGRLDTKALRVAHPLIAEQFTGPPSERFEVVADDDAD